jgi:hypothetical protein
MNQPSRLQLPVILLGAVTALLACEPNAPTPAAPAASVTPFAIPTVAVSTQAPVINYGPVGAQQFGNNNVVQIGPKPRDLTADEQATLATSLKPFAGLKVNVFQYSLGEPEIASLAGEIEGALRTAGVVVTECRGTEMGDSRSPRPIPGILVEVRQSTPPTQLAAKALADALRSPIRKVDGPLPFDAFGRGANTCSGTEDPNAALQLTIGRNNGP